jgi:predicted GIY-YIG superfamily endonuclease
MQQSLDIVELIENNPIKNFNKEYHNKFIEKIKKNFNENQINLFVASFYSYLNYDQEKDYVIELNNIWKWLGFSRKDSCKVVLEKHFEKDKDYIIKTKKKAAPELDGAGGAGLNKEYIYMNIKTFKKLCMKTCTKTADDIHDYFIKLEEIFHEIISEESNELREQLKLKDKELEESLLKIIKEKEKTLLHAYDDKFIVYLIKLDKNLYKFGSSENIKRRLKEHKKIFGNQINLIYCIETKNHILLENKFKEYLATTNLRIEQKINNKLHNELISINDNEINILENKLEYLNENLYDNKQLIIELKEKISKLEKENRELQMFKTQVFPKSLYIKYIEDNLEYNLGSKIATKTITKHFGSYIANNKIILNKYSEQINEYKNIYIKNYNLELIKYIIEYFNKVLFKESDRLSRSFFVNLAIKNSTSFYSNEIYNNFISENIEINNLDKSRSKEGYIFKAKIDDVIFRFNNFVAINNINSLCELENKDLLFRKEIKKIISEITSCKISKAVLYEGKRHVSFIGIKLIENN